MKMEYRKRLAAATLIMASSPTAMATSCVADIGYRWWSSVGYYTNMLTDSLMSSLLQSVGDEFTTKTDLDGGSGPNGEGEIRWVDGNYGASIWAGLAIAYDGVTPCADWSGNLTGQCNTTTNRPDNATIYLNHDVLAPFVYQTTMLHEMGHIVGMAHVSFTSFMQPVVQIQQYTLLSCEIEGLNLWY